MTPTWYDLLGVDRDADADEIRAAWKGGIADLEPGDRRFETLNRAAKVLLDPDSRADYDASLAPEEPAVEEGAVAPVTTSDQGLVTGLRPSSTSGDAPSSTSGDGSPASTGGDAPASTGGDAPASTGGATARPGTLLLAGLAALALALVLATTWVWLRADDASGDGSAAREAQQAAEAAVVPVLSYDHRQLDEDQERARALMTGSYREEYDKIFALIEENAPRLETQVDVSVVASGIVRASDDRVQVLVFVDRPTTNKQQREPVVYKDQVTLTMQLVDGEWLVDDMVTSPVQE